MSTTSAMNRLWHTASFDKDIRKSIAIELGASWPIPLQVGSEVQVCFFYYTAFRLPPATEFKLYPPAWKVILHSDSHKVLTMERLKPADAGLMVAEGQPFSTHSWPKDWKLEQVDVMRETLLESYDRIVPLWKVNHPLTTAQKEMLRQFCELFVKLTEAPYLPCYHHFGAEFFKFVGVPRS